MRLKITVTERDIKCGKKFNPEKCPIALAVRRKGYKTATVGLVGIYWSGGPYSSLPDEAVEFRRGFDYERPVRPFSFYVEKPGGRK